MAKRVTEDGVRYIASESGIWFEREAETGKWWTDHQGTRYELERRRRHPRDVPDTGWYLYGGTYFGEWCGSLIMWAVDKAAEMILAERAED